MIINTTCTNCNKPITRTSSKIGVRNFCTRTCAAISNNKLVPKRSLISRICRDCNNLFIPVNSTVSKKVCRPCREIKKNSLKLLSVKDYLATGNWSNLHPQHLFNGVRSLCRRWNIDLPKICQVCGYTNHTEMAHIRAVTDFPDTAILGDINSPNNILILCPNHHWEFDNNLLALADIPPRKP
jgi:hypothetical protein